MAIITATAPDGTSHQFTVDDGFLKLPDDKKQAQLEELQKAMQGGTAGAAPAAPSDTSYGSALQYGAGGVVSGLGATVSDLGGVAARNGLPEMGGAVQRAGNYLKSAGANISPGPGYAPAGPAVAQAFREGRYRDAAGNLLRAGVEGVPDLAATLGTAAIAGPAGPAAYIAGRSLGPTADARAANNGETSASTGDVLAAIPSTAAQAAIGTLGIGKFGPAASVVSAAPRVLRPLVRTGEEAVAGAANDAAQQLGGSAGTTKGAQLDPAESAVAAAQAGAARGLSEGARAVQEGAGGLVNAAQARSTPRIEDPVQAASIERVNRELDAARGASTPRNGAPPPDNVVLNTVKSTLAAHLTALTKQIKPLLDQSQAVYLNTVIDQALRHNNDIGAGGDGYRSLFDTVGDLPVASEVKSALTAGIVDLNTVSTQSFEKNLQGPFQKAGAFIGRVAPIAHGAITGNIGEAAIGAITGAGSHGIGATVGGSLGRVADNFFGTAVPNVTLARARAQQALKGAKIGDVGPLSTQRLGDLVAQGTDPTTDLYRQLNIQPPDTVPLTPQQQRARDVADAQAMDRERNQSAAGQAQQDAVNARAAAQAQVIKAAQTAAAIKQNALKQAQQGTGFDKAGAQVAADKQAQEDAMWNQANTLQGQTAKRVAGTAQSEVRGHISDMARVSNARQQLAKLMDRGTTLNENAANTVAGMAYRGLPAREARNNGLVGAKATNVGPSPAYAASGGADGAPAGQAPIIQQAPVKRAQARMAARGAVEAPAGTPAPTLAGGPAKAPVANPGASERPVGFGQAPPPGTGFTSGWKSYVHQGLQSHDIPHTADDIHQAIAHTVANGELARVLGTKEGVGTMADTLAHFGGDLRGPKGLEIIHLIAAQVAQNKGMTRNLAVNRGAAPVIPGVSTEKPAGGASDVPNGGPRGPIQNLHRWKGAAATAQHTADTMAGAEEARGNVDLARTIRSMAAVPAASRKTAVANKFLSTLKTGSAEHDHAVKVLATPSLRKGV